MATCVPPSVPFLKPTGIEAPRPNSQCTWLSAVPGTDRDPRGQVRDVLGYLSVEKLGAGRHPEFVDVQQQLAGEAKALVDVVALVEVRIVDEPLPAHHRSRFFEVRPHHEKEPLENRSAKGLSIVAYSRAAFTS